MSDEPLMQNGIRRMEFRDFCHVWSH